MIFVDGVDIGDLGRRRPARPPHALAPTASSSSWPRSPSRTARSVAEPEVIFRGVPFPDEADELLDEIRATVEGVARARRRRGDPRDRPAAGDPPRRPGRVRLRAAPPAADGAAGRGRGLAPRPCADRLRDAAVARQARLRRSCRPARPSTGLRAPPRAAAARATNRAPRRAPPSSATDAAVGLGDGADDRQAQAATPPRSPAPRTKRSNTRGAQLLRHARPVVRDLERRPRRRRVDGDARMRVPGGVWRSAFSIRLSASRCSSSRAPWTDAGWASSVELVAAPPTGPSSAAASTTTWRRSVGRCGAAAPRVGARQQQQVGRRGGASAARSAARSAAASPRSPSSSSASSSRLARTLVSGVRSSCEASATNSRWRTSVASVSSRAPSSARSISSSVRASSAPRRRPPAGARGGWGRASRRSPRPSPSARRSAPSPVARSPARPSSASPLPPSTPSSRNSRTRVDRVLEVGDRPRVLDDDADLSAGSRRAQLSLERVTIR